MTQLLEQAFAEAAKLPDLQQNRLAKWLIDELLIEKNEILVLQNLKIY